MRAARSGEAGVARSVFEQLLEDPLLVFGKRCVAQIHEMHEARAERGQLRVLALDLGEALGQTPCRQRCATRDDDHGAEHGLLLTLCNPIESDTIDKK